MKCLPFVALVLAVCSCSGQVPEREAPERAPATRQSPMAELEETLAAAEKNAGDKTALPYRTCFPLARLQLKKAKLASSYTYAMGSTVGAIAEKGLTALELLSAGKRFSATPGRLNECAYIADCDGTVQPYYLYLPPDYDANKKCPLVVFLHGYVPSISVLRPWVLGEETCAVAGDAGCALLIPYGRRNSDFQGVGEVDVLGSTEEVKALYNIDPERIYMSGVSMGGMGAWNMLLRHPGMYAAGTPMSGHTNMHAWWPRICPDWPESRDGLKPFRRPLIEWDNAIDLVMNARNQPLFLQHGELDSLIPVSQSRTMVAASAKLGIPIKYYEFKGESHYIYWDLPCFQNAWPWQAKLARERRPKHVTYKTYSLEYDRAFWTQITDLIECATPATLDCEVVDDGKSIRLTTANIRELMIDADQAPLAEQAEYEVMVNGRKQVLAPRDGRIAVECAPASPAVAGFPPRKRKGLYGPVEEVFDTRFMVVAGTSGNMKQIAANSANARRWAKEWDEFADGAPRLKTDKQVTDADIANHNLILFGTPESNVVLAKIADKLPVKIGDHSYTIAGKTYAGPDLGLVMCYPNPLAPDKYVAVYAGEFYGERCGLNHKHDLIPDFIVFRANEFSFDGTNEHEVAGYFDMNWRLSDKLTWGR